MPPTVSVVIPTYRRPLLLSRCLDCVLGQMLIGHGFEVVVVDDGHDDATRAVVIALAQALGPGPDRSVRSLRYVRPASGRGPAVARNAGWRAAAGTLIAFTDDDTLPQPGWLARGVQALLGEPGCAALSGRVGVAVTREREGRPTDHELMTMGLEQAEFVTANAFVRRSALERVGGFDERFTRAWREDSDLHFRLLRDAGRVERCDAAVVLHPVRPERWGVCLRQQRNALFEALLYKLHPRMYRERIDPSRPWLYYAVVTFAGTAIAAVALAMPKLAFAASAAAFASIAAVAARRLRQTSRAPGHVWEMIATSALIPFMSVYWRLRGALRYRVLFF